MKCWLLCAHAIQVGSEPSSLLLASAFGSILIPAVLNGKSLENAKWLLEVGHSVATSKFFMQHAMRFQCSS